MTTAPGAMKRTMDDDKAITIKSIPELEKAKNQRATTRRALARQNKNLPPLGIPG